MQNFTNTFFLSANADKTEIILSFSQNYPVPNEDGTKIEIKNESIANLVMTKETAKTLTAALNDLVAKLND